MSIAAITQKHLALILLAVSCFSVQDALGQTLQHAIPCRVRDGGNHDLFVMTLGDVKPPIAQGLFYPDQDRVRLNDGSVIDHYYRDTLGIRYYRPIDKSVFAAPPSGWCSWYFYFNEISEAEIRSNARWLAENLKEFGLQYVQIDDGWQGAGRGMNANRDWTTINDRFPSGMKTLAADIKKLGLKPAPGSPPTARAIPGSWSGTKRVSPQARRNNPLRHLGRDLPRRSVDRRRPRLSSQPVHNPRGLGLRVFQDRRPALRDRRIPPLCGPDAAAQPAARGTLSEDLAHHPRGDRRQAVVLGLKHPRSHRADGRLAYGAPMSGRGGFGSRWTRPWATTLCTTPSCTRSDNVMVHPPLTIDQARAGRPARAHWPGLDGQRSDDGSIRRAGERSPHLPGRRLTRWPVSTAIGISTFGT